MSDPLATKEINTLDQEFRRCTRRSHVIRIGREVVATLLKVIAGGASVAVALNQWPACNQVFGSAAVLAVFLDGVTSNQKQLMAIAKAAYAFEFVGERIRREYNRALNPIRRVLLDPDESPAAKRDARANLAALEDRTQKEMLERLLEIKSSIAEAKLRALDALALDNERAANQLPAANASATP